VVADRILDLPSIERSLRAFQADLAWINESLNLALTPLEDKEILNILQGYALISHWIEQGVDMLAPGNSPHLLELNACVLCGPDPADRSLYAGHLAATRERFYDQRGGGIGSLVEWNKRHRGEDVWTRAAGSFLAMIGDPQLFIEGNHRTGVLFINYLLLREGLPPFVLGQENALPFFTITANIRKHFGARLAAMIGTPYPWRNLAILLRDNATEGVCHML
jgi:hypothetical protein